MTPEQQEKLKAFSGQFSWFINTLPERVKTSNGQELSFWLGQWADTFKNGEKLLAAIVKDTDES